jgi:hypothetical protein
MDCSLYLYGVSFTSPDPSELIDTAVCPTLSSRDFDTPLMLQVGLKSALRQSCCRRHACLTGSMVELHFESRDVMSL